VNGYLQFVYEHETVMDGAPTAARRLYTRLCPPPRLHFHAPTGGASARDTTSADAPPPGLACDEARTARMGGGGGEGRSARTANSISL